MGDLCTRLVIGFLHSSEGLRFRLRCGKGQVIFSNVTENMLCNHLAEGRPGRDAAAVVRCLAWIDAQEPGSFSEIDVVRRLERCRCGLV